MMNAGRGIDADVGVERRHLGPRVPVVMLPKDIALEQLSVLDVAPPAAILPRDAATTTGATSSSSSTCGPNDNTATCEKPITNSTYTIPIALSIAIPLAGALIALFFLHRRHVRKQRAEDANDPHKSMDFGLGDVARKQKGGKGAGMMTRADIDMYEKPGRERQRSMDLNIVSPYLLPPELQSSRESLHSLSRTIHQQEDPYRPVAEYVASDAQSMRSLRPKGNGSSIYTSSSSTPSRLQESSTTDLLASAAAMSRSGQPPLVPAPRHNSLAKNTTATSPLSTHTESLSQLPQQAEPPYPSNQPEIQMPPAPVQRKAMPGGLPLNPRPSPNNGLSVDFDSKDSRDSYLDVNGPALRNSHNYLGAFINAQEETQPEFAPPPPSKSPDPQTLRDNKRVSEEGPPNPPSAWGSLPTNPRPPRNQSLQSNQSISLNHPPQLPQIPEPEPEQAWIDDESDYGDHVEVMPSSPGHQNIRPQRYSMDVPPEEYAQAGLGAPGVDPRRISMGFRPLPPNAAVESDDPEIRANRIRSFYKEYFDDSKPAPQGQYYEDYDQNYLGDVAYYDPNSNNFVMPYAQPVTRRAMTPPPQSQRFMGQPPRAFHGSVGGYDGRGLMPPGPRAHSSASGRMPPPGPRSYSSASGRMGPPNRGRPLPPPITLNTLPTPSKLRDDSFALMNSIDFAPPVSYKERQTGRSQSPLGERRPYSPALPVYKPLASTYDELPAMPSPHLLRKSGTFTGLDFAPPRRIRDGDTMSDAGSIRSNRSGVSAVHQNAIRTGAYRVSRLPGDTIFSKDEMASALKPTWKLGN